MSILTERRTWKRKQSERAARYHAIRTLTPEERANVRRVVKHLVVAYGGASRLARAMGISRGNVSKASAPSRPQSARLVFILARVAGVGVDDILAGRWQRHACPDCGHVGAHQVAR